MQYANDENGKRIHIDNAKKGDAYFCPVCGGAVIPKQGEFNMWHFAHRQGIDCLDDWNHSDNDMSEWHREWQERFPEENREFIIKKDDEIHRADVCTGNYVIEFQHSPISANEVARRNDFYTSAGYKVIWVFDKIDKWKNKCITADEDCDEIGAFVECEWKYASIELSYVIPQNSKNVAVLFQLHKADCSIDKDDIDYIVKVELAMTEENGIANYSRFYVDEEFNPYLFSEDGRQEIMMTKRERFKKFLSNKKYTGKCARKIDNHPSYGLCEKTKTWHHCKCRQCEYNIITEYRTCSDGKKHMFFYCAYPKKVNDFDERLVEIGHQFTPSINT